MWWGARSSKANHPPAGEWKQQDCHGTPFCSAKLDRLAHRYLCDPATDDQQVSRRFVMLKLMSKSLKEILARLQLVAAAGYGLLGRYNCAQRVGAQVTAPCAARAQGSGSANAWWTSTSKAHGCRLGRRPCVISPCRPQPRFGDGVARVNERIMLARDHTTVPLRTGTP